MERRTLIRRMRRRDLDYPDLAKRQNQLLGSISDCTYADPLNLEQYQVLIEHLRHALVIGFEAGLKAK